MGHHINSYPSIYALGHKNVQEIFEDDVYVEEKVDGSQFSFGLLDGELVLRSKGAEIFADAPEKMFTRAADAVKSVQCLLQPGFVYRGEYLQKPHHNTLAYDRVPKQNIIIFDINSGIETYLSYDEKKLEADRLGFECVPLLYSGKITDFEQFKGLLETMSILGGSKIEGVVIKNYTKFTSEKKIMIAKYVSEQFKEVHQGEWRKNNPVTSDIITEIINRYRTPARWQKAVNHLREKGLIEGSPRDIGKLIIEIPDDVKAECEDDIKEILFKYAWDKIRRGITNGMPEWYKELLAQSAFDNISEEE